MATSNTFVLKTAARECEIELFKSDLDILTVTDKIISEINQKAEEHKSENIMIPVIRPLTNDEYRQVVFLETQLSKKTQPLTKEENEQLNVLKQLCQHNEIRFDVNTVIYDDDTTQFNPELQEPINVNDALIHELQELTEVLKKYNLDRNKASMYQSLKRQCKLWFNEDDVKVINGERFLVDTTYTKNLSIYYARNYDITNPKHKHLEYAVSEIANTTNSEYSHNYLVFSTFADLVMLHDTLIRIRQYKISEVYQLNCIVNKQRLNMNADDNVFLYMFTTSI